MALQNSTPPPAPIIIPGPDPGREEVKRYVDFIKWTVGVISMIVVLAAAVGAYATYQSLHDARVEYSDALKDLRSDYNTRMTDLLNYSKDVKEDAKSAIQETKEKFGSRLNIVEDSIKNIVVGEVNKSIAKEFDAENIRNLIEVAAQTKIAEPLDRFVTDKMRVAENQFQTQFLVTNELILATDRIRNSDRSALEKVDSMRRLGATPQIRNLADRVYNQKAVDYEEALQKVNKRYDTIVLSFQMDTANIKGFEKVTAVIMAELENTRDLSAAAAALVAMRKITGIQFKMFDFQSVLRWYKDLDLEQKKAYRDRFDKRKIFYDFYWDWSK